MNMTEVFSWIFVLAATISAIGILLIKNVFKAAILLFCCLLSIAALYIMLSAEMLGVTQILLYAGGVIVLILFGIMLSTRTGGTTLHVEHGNIFGGLLLGSLLLYALLSAYASFPLRQPAFFQEIESISATGLEIMSNFLLPFELSAVLLLIALIGAVVISSTSIEKR
ncbi:MAG TPA: NADH-quinone oxidoreductase subunit J [Chryseosolibacter sp.]|nr:NADH-quinone oxidoreductase subunit J [Chryseosolibacter sp.]